MGRTEMPVALADMAVVIAAVTFTRPREIKGKYGGNCEAGKVGLVDGPTLRLYSMKPRESEIEASRQGILAFIHSSG